MDIELSGKLNSEEMQTALDELESKSQDIENGIMLYDVVEFHLPSLEAIVIEFSRLPSMFGLMRKFRKAAVLSDDGLVKTPIYVVVGYKWQFSVPYVLPNRHLKHYA